MSPFERFSLKDQVAIITGSAAGTGREVAELFAAAGASVILGDLEVDEADSVAQQIRQTGGQAISVYCDVASAASRMDLVDAALDEFGKVSILVNNAADGGPLPFDMSVDILENRYRLNVFSGFHLCQLCAPKMEQIGGGAILNISSSSDANQNTRMTRYASSVATMNQLTRNLAFDLGSKGIRVNAIAAATIKATALASMPSPGIEPCMLCEPPLSPLGNLAAIASAALFLCSPAAASISGQVIAASGGGTRELE